MSANQFPPNPASPQPQPQPQPGDQMLGPGVFMRDGVQYGDALPQHLRGTRPVGLARRVVFHLVNGFVLQILLYAAAYLVQLGGLQMFEPNSIEFNWTGTWFQLVVNIALLIYYAVTGWMLPLAPWFRIRQVRVSEAAAPGWRGVMKYIVHGLLTVLLIIPYLVVVFGTRDQVQRHAVDRLTDIIVLDVAADRDPLQG